MAATAQLVSLPVVGRAAEAAAAAAAGNGLASGLSNNLPASLTSSPIVTGTSVLGIKYKDGVMLAADMLASYGSTKRYKSVSRLARVSDKVVIGFSGELSDFQYILRLLDELTTDDFTADDGVQLTPKDVYSYLTRVLYNRRNKFDPLWNSLVVGGAGGQDGSDHFLGFVSMIGAHYEDSHVATGFGNHLSRPLFRVEHRDDMSEEEAVALLEKCLRVLFYRDKQSINKVQIAKVTKAGVAISEPYAITSDWSFEAFKNPSRGVPGSW